jgi:small subunit ribosomal protein S8
MLTRIRNGITSRHDRVEMPVSKLKVEIARILKSEGFISNYKVIERVSRPGKRVYRGKEEIPRVLGGLGLAIVSTSKGVLSGTEAARAGVGGEVLCQVW